MSKIIYEEELVKIDKFLSGIRTSLTKFKNDNSSQIVYDFCEGFLEILFITIEKHISHKQLRQARQAIKKLKEELNEQTSN